MDCIEICEECYYEYGLNQDEQDNMDVLTSVVCPVCGNNIVIT